MGRTLGELAAAVNGRVRGDEGRVVSAVRTLGEAGPDDLAFLTQARYRDQAIASRAGAILVAEGEVEHLEHDLVVCADPGWGLARVLDTLYPEPPVRPGVDPTARVAPDAVVAATAEIGPFVVIGSKAAVGERCRIDAGAVVGASCQIGDDSVIHPRAVLYPNTELGRGVVVHAGAVLGSDGFGYATHEGGIVKVPQVGKLVVEDGVEIGANTTIDRATVAETRIGAFSKLDNLVQVGHNVVTGPGCVICGQAGIAGSARLGAGVVMAGQAGSSGHLEIGDGVQVAAKSAVLQSVEAGRKVAGIPAVDLDEWRRRSVLMGRLRDLFRRVRRLEKEEGSE